MPDEILIVGGGFAGLAAGVALAQAGQKVRVIEQRPYLGGRARSFHYSPTNSTVDNGQHIFMGCYTSTIEFLRTIGTLHRLRFQRRLEVKFVSREDGKTSLAFPRLPAPLHLILGTLRSNSFAWSEKLEILSLGRALQFAGSGAGIPDFASLTVDGWLAALGQSEKLRRKFWDLLCIAALNELSEIAAAAIFEPVLRLALFRSPEDSRIGFASSGLSECYTSGASNFIRENGGRIELERNVTELLLAESGSANRCEGVRLSNGSAIQASTVLSAVPAFQFRNLLPKELLTTQPVFAALNDFRPAPIISINLWFDRSVTDLDFVGLRQTTVQWMFNRSMLAGAAEGYVSLVISGAHAHIHKDKEELVALSLQELRELFPLARNACLIHSLVIKERFATFSPSVDAAGVRPPAVTPIRGLYLAGDWTQTGLPATIESAVKSGFTAASEIISAERLRTGKAHGEKDSCASAHLPLS
jgi:hydroxysqualene dehydroxylase